MTLIAATRRASSLSVASRRFLDGNQRKRTKPLTVRLLSSTGNVLYFQRLHM